MSNPLATYIYDSIDTHRKEIMNKISKWHVMIDSQRIEMETFDKRKISIHGFTYNETVAHLYWNYFDPFIKEYISHKAEEIRKKVFAMYTDPNHVRVEDPGSVEGNVVFTYLDIFCKEDSFSKYLPEYKSLEELKEHYRRGGLGDVKIKKFLNDILQEELKPIRERREELAKNPEYVYNVLKEGTKKAREKARQTLDEVKEAMKINYFE